LGSKSFNNELSSLAYNWLSLTGNQVSGTYCKDEINNHPDYPALTALTDFLESGGIEYNAVQADASYIHEFQYPVLAHIKQPGNEYMHLITDVGAWEIQKEITKDWSGIALYAVKGSKWKNAENDQFQKLQWRNKAITVTFITAGILAWILSVLLYPHWLINTFGLLSLAGLVISIAALGTELGYQSKLVKQVCGTVSNGGCEKVLRSKFAKGVAGITPADASVLYFTAQFIIYLAGCVYNPLLSGIINLAFAGIAIAGWSIYTQAVKLKEWCALCLCIVGILLLQSGISFIEANLLNNTYYSYGAFVALALLLTLGFLPLKQLIKASTGYKNELNALKKWKTDASLFHTQLDAEPQANISIWENDLLIGSPNAPLRITVACNAYCGPCAKAHAELDTILERFPGKVNVQIRLLCNPENPADKRTIATKAILQQAAKTKNVDEMQSMLTDWFHWMDLEKWKQKWHCDTESNVDEVLKKHATWMDDAEIAFTPTFFINGKRMPGRYNLKDIEKLIPQLVGSFAGQEN
jgi:uncharacterized membrane protein